MKTSSKCKFYSESLNLSAFHSYLKKSKRDSMRLTAPVLETCIDRTHEAEERRFSSFSDHIQSLKKEEKVL